ARWRRCDGPPPPSPTLPTCPHSRCRSRRRRTVLAASPTVGGRAGCKRQSGAQPIVVRGGLGANTETSSCPGLRDQITFPRMTLKGKRIVVLGGTSGIGLAVAQLALEEGASVVVASQKADAVERARAELGRSAPSQVEAAVVDVASEDSVEAFFAKLGPFDH